MKVLIIDNFDSFTFNLYQCVGEILSGGTDGFALDVFRNTALSYRDIAKRSYDKIILSPGPGHPADPAYFGVCGDVLAHLGKTVSILGVCLGMQGMACVFGGRVIPASSPMHGKSSTISHDGKGVFFHLPQNLSVMRYHSLIVDSRTLPSCLSVTARVGSSRCGVVAGARDVSGDIMGLRHRTYPIEGVQFHPESFATEGGVRMLRNFLYSDYRKVSV